MLNSKTKLSCLIDITAITSNYQNMLQLQLSSDNRSSLLISIFIGSYHESNRKFLEILIIFTTIRFQSNSSTKRECLQKEIMVEYH